MLLMASESNPNIFVHKMLSEW